MKNWEGERPREPIGTWVFRCKRLAGTLALPHLLSMFSQHGGAPECRPYLGNTLHPATLV